MDDSPSKKQVRRLAELRIRNLDAFAELKALNDTGKFLYKHPLIRNHSEQVRLQELHSNKPVAFAKEYSLTCDNVKRYSSFLKNAKRSPEQKVKDTANLKKHQEHAGLMEQVMEGGNGNN